MPEEKKLEKAVNEGTVKEAAVNGVKRGQRRYGRFHLDVFVGVQRVDVDGCAVFADGVYTV